jgi:fructokinase
MNPSATAPTGPDGTSNPADVIAVAGEALIDLVPADTPKLFEAAPGGSPANVAVGLARLEVPVRLLARIADDPLGRLIRAHLAGNGVDLSHSVHAQEPTSLAIIALGEDGIPEYDFRIDGTADWQWQEGELAAALDGQLAALHVGSLALTMPPGAEVLTRLIHRARQHATVSYDPNCRPLLMGAPEALRARVEALVAAADIVKVSAEDLAWLLPGQPPVEVATAWQLRGPAIVAVTLGPGGVVAATADGLVRRPGRSVAVVDTIGAGDAFSSGLLASLYRRGLLGPEQRARLKAIDRGTLARVLDEAVMTAAITCTRRGADPPSAAELRARLR